MSQNSSLRESCAQVSQIVFQAYLTVLMLIATVGTKLSQNSYDHRVRCTNIRNLSWFDRLLIWPCSYLTVLRLLQQYEIKMSQNWNLCQFCAQVSQNVFFSWFDRFTAYYNCLSKNVTKLMSREFCAQASQIVFLVDLTVLRLITTVWRKMSQISYLRELCAQVSQNVFLADLNVSRHSLTVWAKL